MKMLELQNLHKTFHPGTVNEKAALNGVSLKMEAGDFATIVGSNGAGKSTLFNAITGGFIADEGSIELGGQDITFAPEFERSRERFSHYHESFYAEILLFRNIGFFLRNNGMKFVRYI